MWLAPNPRTVGRREELRGTHTHSHILTPLAPSGPTHLRTCTHPAPDLSFPAFRPPPRWSSLPAFPPHTPILRTPPGLLPSPSNTHSLTPLPQVELLTRLRHPNIVRCLGVLIEPPTIGLVLEFISGHDLTRALRKPTPPGFALGVARGVACGMEHLHSRGILHRDLKGGNIMVGYGTGTGTADRKRHGQNSPERNSVGANGADGPGREQRNSFGPQGRCVGGAPAGGGGGAGGGGDTSAGEGGGASTAGGGGGGVGGGCAASPLSELQVKIIDLGLAAPAPDESVGGWLTAETGTYRWMAPEVRKQ